MPQSVSDVRSNRNDQIAHAVDAIGRSRNRRAVFEAVCFGKKATKSVSEIVERTGLNRKQVLNAGKHLVHEQVINQTSVDGEVAYEKDSFLSRNRKAVYRLLDSPEARASHPTKVRPQSSTGSSEARVVTIEVPTSFSDVERLTIDDIESFSRVRDQPLGLPKTEIAEADFKRGIQCILEQEGDFKDWGGELNDLFTTHVKVSKSREAAAFAFKGPGTRGRLVPGKMGKNGDQIQRLFSTTADVYILQYWGEIDQSVHELASQLAVARSVATGRRVAYVVMDGSDSTRLIRAYPDCFPGSDADV